MICGMGHILGKLIMVADNHWLVLASSNVKLLVFFLVHIKYH